MTKDYIIALDQGTTSSRAILFNKSQEIMAVSQKEFRQIYPQSGYVEQDPMEIYSSQYGVLMEVVAKSGISPAQIAAVGITNQRETTIIWDKSTGEPVYNAIVWQCRRTSAICERLKAEGWEPYIRESTGLLIDAYFSATKIAWILDQVPGVRKRAEAGELLFGTVDTWLIWKLTGGKVHATDYTNASRTMLFNISTLEWDQKILELLNIPRSMLPEVRPSSGHFGTLNLSGVEIPISGAAGDQQAALYGQTCFDRGSAKNTYGTGCFLLMNTGETLCRSKNGMRECGGKNRTRYRGNPLPEQKRDAHHHRRLPEGQNPVCPGGQRLHGRGGGTVAAGRAPPDHRILRQRVLCPEGAGLRRGVHGSRLYRPGCPSLGYVRQGRAGGPQPGQQ